MRLDRFSTFLLVLLAPAVVPVPAAAQQVSSPYRFVEPKQDLGPFLGWIATGRGSADLGPKGGLVYGLRYSLRLSDPLGLGVIGAYFPTERDVINPRAAEGEPRVLGTEDMNVLLIAARLRLNLTGARTWHDLAPYIFLGLGLAVDLTGDAGCTANSTRANCQLFPRERFDFGNTFMGQVGLGTVWLPSERIGVRIAVHDNIWRLETPEGFFDPEVQLDPVPPEDVWTNNIQLTLALTLWF